jgi:hypothetical protein
MDPTSFRFVLTMPGDARLVGIIRDLTSQAGTYAMLDGEATGTFTQQVADATESAIAETGVRDVPIEFRFFRSSDLLRVTITWRRNGTEQRRDVEQKTSA